MILCDKLGVENIVCNVSVQVGEKSCKCRLEYDTMIPEVPIEFLDVMSNNPEDWDDVLKTLYETGEYSNGQFRMVVL